MGYPKNYDKVSLLIHFFVIQIRISHNLHVGVYVAPYVHKWVLPHLIPKWIVYQNHVYLRMNTMVVLRIAGIFYMGELFYLKEISLIRLTICGPKFLSYSLVAGWCLVSLRNGFFEFHFSSMKIF